MQERSSLLRHLLLPFFLLFKHAPALSGAGGNSAALSFVCGSANYYTANSSSSSSSSVYESNLKLLLASLSSRNASLSGFKSDSAGREADKVEGLVLCRGDMNADDCGSCLRSAARDILNLCPRNKNATSWYQACLLHYSDGGTVLSSVDNVPYVTLYNVENQTDAYGFVKFFRDAIMNGLAYQAANNSPKKYATAAANFTKLQTTIYGIAQCTPDLTTEECNRCLQDLNDMVPSWFDGRKGGRVLGIRCAMRFETDPFFHGTPMNQINSSEDLNLSAPPASSKSLPLIGVGVGICILFLLIGIIAWLIWFWKKRQLVKMRSKFFKQNGGLLLQQQFSAQGIDAATKIFTLEELRKATSNFSDAQIVGRGGHGTVYKGTLKDNRVVAIKKSIQLHEAKHSEQFINEIVVLSQINHRNIIKLLGCCLDTQVPLLVYEFIPNGSLFTHIHGDRPLPWKDRLRIAAETAEALAYLHGVASTTPIIHRDVKSSNILLDENFTTKVSDFGASRSIPCDHTHVTTVVQGTHGYLDPEYISKSQLTEKSDVYSFGVVLAELLTGELPISFKRLEVHPMLLASYFVCLFDQKSLTQMTEPQMLEEAGEERLLEVAQVARSCLHLKGEERPTMKEVARQLERLELGTKFSNKLNVAGQEAEELRFLKDGNRRRASNVASSARHSFVHELFSSMDLPR